MFNKMRNMSAFKLGILSSAASFFLAAGFIPTMTAYAQTSISPMAAGKAVFTNIDVPPGQSYTLGYNYSSSDGIFSDGYTDANVPFYVSYVGTVVSGQWLNPAGTLEATNNQHQTGQSGGTLTFWLGAQNNNATLTINSLTLYWN